MYLFGVEGSDEGVVHFFDYRRVEFDPIAPAAIPAQLGYETDCVHGDTPAIRRWLDCGLHNEATLAAAINECANRKSFRWPNFGESHVHVFIDMGRTLPHSVSGVQVFFRLFFQAVVFKPDDVPRMLPWVGVPLSVWSVASDLASMA
jgi:hypothetical protein